MSCSTGRRAWPTTSSSPTCWSGGTRRGIRWTRLTAVVLALDELFHDGTLGADDAGRTRLAAACVRAENEVAGAATGGMDQAAALRTTAGHALLIDSRDASVRQVPLDLDAAGLAVLVIDTRAPHALADGQYASRRAACERVAARLGVRTL